MCHPQQYMVPHLIGYAACIGDGPSICGQWNKCPEHKKCVIHEKKMFILWTWVRKLKRWILSRKKAKAPTAYLPDILCTILQRVEVLLAFCHPFTSDVRRIQKRLGTDIWQLLLSCFNALIVTMILPGRMYLSSLAVFSHSNLFLLEFLRGGFASYDF